MFGPLQLLLIPHFRVGVVAVLRDDRGRYLLFRHTYRASYPWGLPTGFMEHDEQPADALRREIEEESALQVELFPVWRVYVAPRRLANVVFRGHVRGGTFRPSPEISEARWFAAHEIPTLMPGQAQLIEGWEQEERHSRPA